MSDVFLSHFTSFNEWNTSMGDLLNQMNEWLIGFVNCRESVREREKAKKNLEHYYGKLRRLRASRNQRFMKRPNYVEPPKEAELMMRNERKFETALHGYIYATEESYKLMMEAQANRFQIVNPTILNFVRIHGRFLKNIATSFTPMGELGDSMRRCEKNHQDSMEQMKKEFEIRKRRTKEAMEELKRELSSGRKSSEGEKKPEEKGGGGNAGLVAAGGALAGGMMAANMMSQSNPANFAAAGGATGNPMDMNMMMTMIQMQQQLQKQQEMLSSIGTGASGNPFATAQPAMMQNPNPTAAGGGFDFGAQPGGNMPNMQNYQTAVNQGLQGTAQGVQNVANTMSKPPTNPAEAMMMGMQMQSNFKNIQSNITNTGSQLTQQASADFNAQKANLQMQAMNLSQQMNTPTQQIPPAQQDPFANFQGNFMTQPPTTQPQAQNDPFGNMNQNFSQMNFNTSMPQTQPPLQAQPQVQFQTQQPAPQQKKPNEQQDNLLDLFQLID
eukprot:TRINITY_DN4638_c0_g1_i2.p1 TRINITY_DN4638_c0_g1~~TRINITY_DN4638_c0_g1_i2.p1  ORF type:complete len:508 (+),score=86.18 TRINITY_DN4638_c0_g1_i2:32-1525(+)